MPQRPPSLLCFLGILAAGALATSAATFQLDPASGSITNNGSAEQPWPALEQVLRAGLIQAKDRHGQPFNTNGVVKGGDVLELRAGFHGEAVLDGYYLDTPITITAAAGEVPHLQRILLRGGANWNFNGLQVSPSFGSNTGKAAIVAVLNHARHGEASRVTIERCEVFSVPDIAGWTTNQWLEGARDGITLQGEHCRAVSNIVRNVAFGIQLGGVSNYAGYNLVENFRGDGLRTLNHYCVAEFNHIRNAFLADGNHMDGIQGFHRDQPGREVRGVVIRGNIIQRHEHPDTPVASPYLQGIGFFDGPFRDCRFEDNVVEADSYHGLSVYNALDCRITGNSIRGDGGSPAMREGRIVLGCKTAYGQEVRGNVITSNSCGRLIIATQAVDTVTAANQVGANTP